MKAKNYIIVAILCVLISSCRDSGWEDPEIDTAELYGNSAIQETNVMTIAQLRAKYKSQINTLYTYEEITDDIQIKGVVTGNDIGGNIYNQIAIYDGTAAIMVNISQGGLFAYLPVGQQVLIDLKGLYIGNYGKTGQIGVPYTNSSGKTYVSRMSKVLWNEHFKLLSSGNAVSPIEFDKSKLSNDSYKSSNNGMLMTIKGVELQGAADSLTYAPRASKDAGNAVSRALKGYMSGNIVLRTSVYAKFADDLMPTGKVNITGIFTRYNDTWQILMRDINDIESAN